MKLRIFSPETAILKCLEMSNYMREIKKNFFIQVVQYLSTCGKMPGCLNKQNVFTTPSHRQGEKNVECQFQNNNGQVQ